MTRSALLSLSLFALLISGRVASAQATFGAEFNFSSSQILAAQQGNYVNSPASEEGRDLLMKQVLQSCDGCSREIKTNHYGVRTYRITYPDGWYFEIATDPSVVEIQTKPSTVLNITKILKRIQNDIFDAAAQVGLVPATKMMGTTWAGSHIHVGSLSALGSGEAAVKLLRNIMVDFSNHSELANGIFSRDWTNAPPLNVLPEAQQLAFAKIVAEVDAGRIRSVEDFAQRIRDEVYITTIRTDLSPTAKYQAFNVTRIGSLEFDPESQTFEYRAMRGQESAEDFLIEARLIEARITYLKSLQEPVPLNLHGVAGTEESRVLNFYRFVYETGLEFKPYSRFLNAYEQPYVAQAKTDLPKIICREAF